MRVVAVPMLADNYGWLVIDEAAGQAAIVDPAEAEPVLAAAAKERVKLVAVLATHHHADHVGGVEDLLAKAGPLDVYAFAEESRIPGTTHPVTDGGRVSVAGLTGRALFVPCHTRGHVAYVFEDALFSGDTLFSGGCGRFFEGSAADMHRALYEVFGGLPGETRVFSGHEYTARNLEFAATLEPGNELLAKKRAEVAALRARGLPSVPTTLAEERAYNPFLRVVSSEELRRRVAAARPDVDLTDPVRVLGAVRALKDEF